MEERKDYLNYFLPQCPDGITEIRGNQRLITTDLYTNIDLMFSSNQNGLKQYYIIKPGGDPTDIVLLYTGADTIIIDGTTNELSIITAIDTFKFERPTVYQLDSLNNIIDTLSWTADWQTNGLYNLVKFNTGAYDSSNVLIIQVDRGSSNTLPPPNNESMEWSTYFGGSSLDCCKDVETNNSNDVWVLGETSTPDFPLSIGLSTMVFTDEDCFVIKFDVYAHPQWITYFGGSDWDGVADMKLDSKENIYVIGSTTSTDFPNTTTDGMNYSMHGSHDGFFIVLNSMGTGIKCDSYIGANDYDFPFSIDISDNSTESNKVIVIAGISYNSFINNFPLQNPTNAYYQASYCNGRQAFIMRLDYTFSNVWCTFLGGVGDEKFTDVAINSDGDRIVVCGWTSTSSYSTDACNVPTDGGFPHCTPINAYSQLFGGGDGDLMIAEFNSSNQLVWSTYFGGNTNDGCGGLGKPNPRMCFIGEDIYIAATISTSLSSTFPLLSSNFSGSYNQQLANSSNDKNFNIIISRFNSDREQTWCTAYGGFSIGLNNEGMGLNDICSGPNSSFYMTGFADADYVQTANLCSVPTTSGEFPICNFSGGNYMEIDAGTTNIDEHRQYIATFNSSDNLIWSTRFGLSSYLSEGYGIAASSEKLFVVGYSEFHPGQEYTLWELDQAHTDPLDYFQEYDFSNSSGVITRFDISLITSSIEFNETESDNSLIIVPNPASDNINIRLDIANVDFRKILIYNALGNLILNKEIENYQQDFHFDISALRQGLFLVYMTDNEKSVYFGKFVKL